MVMTENKRKAVESFIKEHVVDRWIEELENINNRYQKDQKNIEKNLIETFDRLCKKTIELQEKRLKNKIEYIYISILRTKIMENQAVYRIECYDDRWFLDETEVYENWNADFIYQSLFEHMKDLEIKKSKYLRQINPMDIEKIKQIEVYKYHTLVQEMISEMLEKIVELDSFKKIVSENEYLILVGEYKGDNEVIYQKESD